MSALSRNLVIDADVARASGGIHAAHPTAAITRDFLQAILTICHKAVMTPEIQKEWDKHQSSFARKWRSGMVARRKLLICNPEGWNALRQGINEQDISDDKKNVMLKDCHLVEAALDTGHSVISMDDTARDLFSEAANSIADLRSVLWVNPVHDPTHATKWLENGAPAHGDLSKHWKIWKHNKQQ